MTLALEHLHKTYGETHAVNGVSFTLKQGETLALLGPSGCGKSTLLRLIAGLERPDQGELRFKGERITHLPPQRRGFGMVFQDYALFPHLNVEKNIAFGLVEAGWSRERRQLRVAALLELVGLSGYEKRPVQDLSGGEQQRVALARALAPEPPILLLDEPLSNLDLTLRDTLKEELRELLSDLSVSAVYVTHDQSEALTVAERIAVMRRGQIVQLAPKHALYSHPQSAWVARFLGHDNVYDRIEGKDASAYLLRSDLIRLGTGETEAHVKALSFQGGLRRVILQLPQQGIDLSWEGFARELPEGLSKGDKLKIALPEDAWVALEEDL